MGDSSTTILPTNPSPMVAPAAQHRDARRRAWRVLIVHRYFWPDAAPAAAILRAIGQQIGDSGCEVTVFTGQPGYKPELDNQRLPKQERVGNLRVIRCRMFAERTRSMWRRAINVALFLVQATFFVCFRLRKFDLVISLSFPPVVSGAVVGRLAKWRGSRYLYHVMDIHPEAGHFAGKLRGGWLYRLARWLDARTCQLADKIVVLSTDMQQTLLARPGLGELNKIEVIADFNIPSFESAARTEIPMAFSKDPGKFRVIYAGNLGHFQALDNVVAAARLLKDQPEIEFVFLGEGADKSRLQQLAGDCLNLNIFFFPYQPVAVCDQIMAQADLGVVSLATGVIRVAYPCKNSSYLSLGLPTLVIVEEDSDLFHATVQSEIGYACPPGNALRLRDTILKAYESRAAQAERRQRARQYAEAHLSQDVQLKKWSELIDRMAGDYVTQ